jgi:hypothetical protein
MRLRNQWVWMLVGLFNLPAFLLLNLGIYVWCCRALLRHNPSVTEGLGWIVVAGLWAGPFLLLISIYLVWALNPQVEESYRARSWLMVMAALISFVVGARLISPLA